MQEIANVPQDDDGKSKIFYFEKISSAIAPTIAIMTGMLFLSGYIHRKMINSYIGLNDNFITSSFQDIVADGYIGILITITSLFLIALPIFLTTELTFSILISIIRKQNNIFPLYHRFMKSDRIFRFVNLVNWIHLIALILIMGITSGILHFAFDASNIKSKIKSCHINCYAYTTKSKVVHGLPLTGNADKIVIYQENAVQIINTDEIFSITPPKDKYHSDDSKLNSLVIIWDMLRS